MPLNTITVGAAVTPEVIGTTFNHYLHRKPRRHKPTAHLSYDIGLHLVRRFVVYSSSHTVEEIQAFTGQWVPVPTWIRAKDVEISKSKLDEAALHLQKQLGEDGIRQVGGREWWQWRRDDKPLRAEWVEMKRDYNARKAAGDKGSRIILYIHGGAYYFGSPDEHRYQIVRHARKLKARCLAPRYRLAPQFPFPCGLMDCLAAYLYLLEEYDPSNILIMGDSAGGGMCVSLLVIMRDQGIPLPAGGILLSPWVDLMHSFPSVAAGSAMDYIPANGFIHRPSPSWMPPTMEEGTKMPSGVAAAAEDTDTAVKDNVAQNLLKTGTAGQGTIQPADDFRGYSVTPVQEVGEKLAVFTDDAAEKPTSQIIPSVMVDGQLIEIRDQIQIYAPNQLLTHPLVSPVLQPTLGGLPPLLIQSGGGEMLRDEQIYLAHKAANPTAYLPRPEILQRYDPDGSQVKKWKPTNVQLQVWEDLCHVAHTFSWTRPAKFMYRSCAQFGAWALARAQHKTIEVVEENDESDIDSTDSEIEESRKPRHHNVADEGNANLAAPAPAGLNSPATTRTMPSESTGRAGDPLPPFKHHMIRQRVDRHGRIFALEPVSDLPALQLSPSEIGVLKPGPVHKWLARQQEWNKRFASQKRKLQKQRAKELAKGYVGLPLGEKPPPTALAGRRLQDMPREKRLRKSWGLALWSSWGSKHDKEVADETMKAKVAAGLSSPSGDEVSPEEVIAANGNIDERARATKSRSRSRSKPKSKSRSRHRSFSRKVSDQGQISEDKLLGKQVGNGMAVGEAGSNGVAVIDAENKQQYGDTLSPSDLPSPSVDAHIPMPAETVIPPTESTTTRPTHNGIAYPFRLSVPAHERTKSLNASMLTLDSADDASVTSGGGGAAAGTAGTLSSSSRAGTPVRFESTTSPLREEFKIDDGFRVMTPDIETELDGGRPRLERFITANEKL